MQDPLLKCLYENHHSKQIIGVCVNEECTKMRPYCQVCLKSYFHSEHLHDLSDFSDFYNYVQEGLQKYEQLQNLVGDLQNITKLISLIINQLSFDPKVNLKDMSIIAINNLINQVTRIMIADKSIKKNLEQALLPLQDIKTTFTGQQDKQLKKFEKTKFTLSNNIKNKAINVTQNIAEGFGFCLSDQIVPKTGITTLAFRIMKCDWRIHLGVCQKEQLIEQFFDLNLTHIGHGQFLSLFRAYLINNQGSSYSHHQAELNDVQKSFKFSTKSLITMEINPGQGTITWIKKQPNETFVLFVSNQKMDIDFTKELYPCVKLWGSSKIELINVPN